MNHHPTHQPSAIPPGLREPERTPVTLTIRKIEGYWHVVATESETWEYVHMDGHWRKVEALRQKDEIRRGLSANLVFDLNYWTTKRL